MIRPSPGAPASIEFHSVRFRYASQASDAVAGLSLAIPKGEFLGVIGPNGAGKSTVLRLLLGALRPTDGQVRIGGRDVSAIRSRDLAHLLAAVPQEEALEFPFNVEEVVLLGRASRLGLFGFERPADVAAAREAMELTGVGHLAARPFFTLSGGERKRVVLACALAQQTPVLVLDEPAAALDIQHQIAIFDLLAALNRRGTTVIVVVHDLNLAAAYCRRLLLIRPPVDNTTLPPLAGTVEEILTCRRVRETFGVDVYVGENEVTGHRFLIPMSTSQSSADTAPQPSTTTPPPPLRGRG